MRWIVLCLVAATLFGAEVESLFDGKTLNGWLVSDGDKGFWRVEDGTIVADSNGEKMPRNTFLFSAMEYDHFEFRCQFRLTGNPETGVVNSGIQFRSEKLADWHAAGYQADIGDPSWWGCIYDEHRRNRVIAQSDIAKVGPIVKRNDWNEYVIRAQGPRIQLFLNGQETVNYVETEGAITDRGRFALQLHKGGICRIEYKEITVKKLDGAVDPADAPAWRAAKARINYLESQVSKTPSSPEAEHATFHLADGFVAELVAQESEGIGKFIAVEFDSRGRMWSMTALDYPVDGNQQKAFADQLFKAGGKDKVIVFDTPSAAGVQTPRIFAEKLALPLSIMPYKNGVYAQYGPDIRYYQDTDGDGKADKYEVMLTGFGIQDSHLFPHQFTRGPGGWMYMAQGLFNQSTVVRPDGAPFADGSTAKNYDKCRLARMKLDGSDFQFTTTGPNNLWGLVTGRDGQWYVQEANDKGYPVVPYEFGIMMKTGNTPLIKPYQPVLPPIFDKAVMGGTGLSGLALADDINSPFAGDDKSVKTFYLANPITSSIQIVTAREVGNHRVEWEKQDDFLVAGDKWFRPVAIKFGPDGALYVVDWYNKIISHNEVRRDHPDRDKVRGRIWRIRREDQILVPPPDLSRATPAELLVHLRHNNASVQRTTWLEMIDRNATSILPQLKTIVQEAGERLDVRLAALWACEGLGGADADLLAATARDREPNLRAEAVRIAGRTAKAAAFNPLAIAAATDPTARVRAAVGEALVSRQELDADSVYAAALLGRAAVADGDHLARYERDFERFLARWAMENNPQATAAMLAARTDLPVENRLTAMQSLTPEQAAIAFLSLIPQLTRDLTADELSLITGQLNQAPVMAAFTALLNDPVRRQKMLMALSQMDVPHADPKLNATVAEAALSFIAGDDTPQNRALVMGVAQRLRLTQLAAEISRWTQNAADAETATAGLRCLRELGTVDPQLCVALLGHADAEVRSQAAVALSTAPGEAVIPLMARNWTGLTASDRQTALDGLINSPAKATAFTKALLAGSFGEIDGNSVEKVIVALGLDHPLAKELVAKTGGIMMPVIRLDGHPDDQVDVNVTLAGAFTIESWVRLRGSVTNADTLLARPGDADVNFSAGKLRFYGGKQVKDLVIAKTPVPVGEWTHCAITRSADGAFKLYVNGVLDATGTKTHTGTYRDLDLGASTHGNGADIEYLEFRAWNTALTPEALRDNLRVSYAGSPKPENLVHRFSGDVADLPLRGKASVVLANDFPALMTAEEGSKQAALFQKYEAIVANPGDVARGKAVFQGTCAACHMVNSAGGAIGPDLSGAGAAGDEGLLRNILTPNAALEPGYYRHDLKLKDGGFVSGFLVSETASSLTIRQIGADDRVVPRGDVTAHSISRRSLMPEGLLTAMQPQQVTDLFSYLRTLK